jgi:hypothetical protein
MAEQHLDDADVGAGFEQMRGEAVAQRVNGDRLAQIGLVCGHAAGPLQRRGADRPIPLTDGEQPDSHRRSASVERFCANAHLGDYRVDRPLGPGSLMTRRWREPDSNHRSRRTGAPADMLVQ